MRLAIYDYLSVQEQVTKLALLSANEREVIKASKLLTADRAVSLFVSRPKMGIQPLLKEAWLVQFATSLNLHVEVHEEPHAE